MKKIIFISTILLVSVTLPGFFACQTSSKSTTTRLLKFNMEKGYEYNYEMVWDMKQIIMEQESYTSFGSLYSLNVIEDSGHIKTITGIYRSLKMDMDMMGMKINIDTDKPIVTGNEAEQEKNPINMMKKIFSGIVGKTFTMKVDEEGNIMEVKGFSEMFEAMLNGTGIGEEEKARVLAVMKEQFNEQSVKDQFAPMFIIFPNKEIKTGDSWEKSYTIGGMMPAKYSTTYTVKEIEGDQVTLTTKTVIASNGELEIKGSQSGNVLVDSRSGIIVNAQYENDIETSVQGMKVKVKGKGKIKGTRK